MVRRWLVRPDQVMYVEGVGEVGFVSRDKMQEAFLDAEALVARAGGHVSVSTDRHPTGFPGEMVTTAAAFLWRDRTDAKEQPEQPAPVAAPAPERITGTGEGGAVAVPVAAEPPPLPDVETEPGGETGGEVAEVEDDGLDPSTLEEEDLSSVPESAR